MAKPKIFISSTFYDLKYIRNDLERFIKDLGYEPILNEKGNIPYGKSEKLEFDCYKEINNSDILVSILGSRYGSDSSASKNSITHEELKKAWSDGKQVYIFIDKNILNEHQVWKVNRELEGFKCSYADNSKIHIFINEVMQWSHNNNIHSFETSNDIINYLKTQWAGLFQRFLEDDKKKKDFQLNEQLSNQIDTLKELTNYLVNINTAKNNDLKNLLTMNNALSKTMKKEFQLGYDIVLNNLNKLSSFMNEWGYPKSYDDHIDLEEAYRYMNQNGEVFLFAKNSFDNKGNFINDNEILNYKRFLNNVVEEEDDEFPF